MKTADLVIRKGTLAWTLYAAVLILGWLAYWELPRLDDPQIPIKAARVVTPYPGASAAEVEQEVTEEIERAVQGLSELLRVESSSSRGLSIVEVVVQDRYDKQALPRVWDALRHKIDEIQAELPPGAGPSILDDGPGDFYDAYYALVGEGFTEAELKRGAKLLQSGLVALDGVAQVILFGERQEVLYVEVSTARARALGVGLEEIVQALGSKGLPPDAGSIRVGPEQVAIHPSRVYGSVKDLGELMIAADGDRLIRLGDVAEIRHDYADPPRRLLRIDGRPAVGIAVSALPEAKVVAVGEAVKQCLAELTAELPLGMELVAVALHADTIAETVGRFSLYLVEAALLVIAALLLFLGWRGGLIVGFVALLTLAVTFLVMDYLEIGLQRSSLGALVIALGLIPGNTILMLDGIATARERVAQNALLLLGATAVAVLAFAPIGGIESDAGEYVRPLYLVVLISLSVSWIASVTVAPLLAVRLLGFGTDNNERGDTCARGLHRLYVRTLAAAIHHRWPVLGATALLLALSLYGFGLAKRIYFPTAAVPGFLVEVYFREGTHIRETQRQMDEIQAYLRKHAGVTRVATAVGADHPRHLQTSETAPDLGGHYSMALVCVADRRQIDTIVTQTQRDLEERFPDAVVNVKKRVQGLPVSGGHIQVRISGPDPSQLRRIADQVKALIATDPDAKAVRDGWGAKVKVARPLLAAERARRLGIDRAQISVALRTTYSGTVTGFYRVGREPIPIIVRAAPEERATVEGMADIQVTSPLRGDRISMQLLADRLDTRTEDARRSRRDLLPVITVHADTRRGTAFELLERIEPRIEKALDLGLPTDAGRNPGRGLAIGSALIPLAPGAKIPLGGRPGYTIAWGGEAESFAESLAQSWARIPLCCGLAMLVLIALFKGLRRPLIVLLAAPLSMIGITAGLLITAQPFGFMSLLGGMGLSGLLMRNAILLVDRIDLETRADNERLAGILRAVRSRLRPVGLATGTSILATLPLLQDDFFRSMAVSLISGLGLAGLAIFVVVPVLYVALLPARHERA